MSKTGSNLQLSQLHPLRPFHADQTKATVAKRSARAGRMKQLEAQEKTGHDRT